MFGRSVSRFVVRRPGSSSRIREAIEATYAKRYEHRTQTPAVPEEAK